MVVRSFKLAGFVEIQHGNVVSQHQEDDLVELHTCSIPVFRISLNYQAVIMLPALERKWTAGDNVRSVGPRRSEFFDCLLMQRPEELMRHHADKVRSWFHQNHAQCVVIDRLDAHIAGSHGNKLLTRDSGLQPGICFERCDSILLFSRQDHPHWCMH